MSRGPVRTMHTTCTVLPHQIKLLIRVTIPYQPGYVVISLHYYNIIITAFKTPDLKRDMTPHPILRNDPSCSLSNRYSRTHQVFTVCGDSDVLLRTRPGK